MRAIVGPVHDVLVGPFEVKGIAQRLAQAAVLEFLAPRIDEPALRARDRGIRDHVALAARVLKGRKIVARRPSARGELLAKQIILGGEAFEADLAVAIIFVADGVEIIQPARYWQIGAPPILHPFKFYEMPRFEAPHLIRTAAERRF